MFRGITFGILLTYAFISVTAIQVNVNRPNRDTYLKALENSHGLDLGKYSKIKINSLSHWLASIHRSR